MQAVKNLFSDDARDAQRRQEKLQAEERKKLEAIEDGQAAVRAGGGRGLLAFVDQTSKLLTSLGGLR